VRKADKLTTFKCATRRKVVGSIPDGVIGIFHWQNPSFRTMALGLTQPLTEMSTRNISWRGKGGRCVGLTNLPPSCAECLEIWDPQTPGILRPVMVLLYLFTVPLHTMKAHLVVDVQLHSFSISLLDLGERSAWNSATLTLELAPFTHRSIGWTELKASPDALNMRQMSYNCRESKKYSSLIEHIV
jgi:hypothetical protein